LNYKGWLRADALDEIFLDVSYHNNDELFLENLSGTNEVDADAVRAYKDQKAMKLAGKAPDSDDEELVLTKRSKGWIPL